MNSPGLVVGGGFFEREKVQENCGEWCYLEQPQCGKHFVTFCTISIPTTLVGVELEISNKDLPDRVLSPAIIHSSIIVVIQRTYYGIYQLEDVLAKSLRGHRI